MSGETVMAIYTPILIAFGVVVLTTFGNTLLEWYRRHLHDAREANIIRRAFIEEMRIHRKMYAGAMTPEQEANPQESFLIPADTFMPVFENMIGKIGLLKADEVAAVLRAYSNILLVPKNLGVMGKLRKDEFSTWLEVPSKYTDVLRGMNDQLVAELDAAIACLSGMTYSVTRVESGST